MNMSLEQVVSEEIRYDIAKRKHDLLPTMTRKIDLGEFGEVEAEIQYDSAPSEPRAYDYPGYPGYFDITEIRVRGVDIWPAFDEETQRIFTEELLHALKHEGKFDR